MSECVIPKIEFSIPLLSNELKTFSFTKKKKVQIPHLFIVLRTRNIHTSNRNFSHMKHKICIIVLYTIQSGFIRAMQIRSLEN